MKRIIVLFVFLVLVLPFVFALENESLTSFFQEKIENESGSPILNDTSQTIWTFEEVVTYAVYFIVGLVVLVVLYLLYNFFRRKGNRNRYKNHYEDFSVSQNKSEKKGQNQNQNLNQSQNQNRDKSKNSA